MGGGGWARDSVKALKRAVCTGPSMPDLEQNLDVYDSCLLVYALVV